VLAIRSSVKRGIDIVVATELLVILSPLLAAVVLAILVRMAPPVLFRQERRGREANPLVILKVRTMLRPRRGEVESVTDSVRLTTLGARLRRYSLDELPELWNVLHGDMSLIEPRPLLMVYQPFFTDRDRRRFEVPPV